jgi:hypothetical protein
LVPVRRRPLYSKETAGSFELEENLDLGQQHEAAADVLWTDAQLIEVCLDGDQGAWAALVDKYKNLIYPIPVR